MSPPAGAGEVMVIVPVGMAQLGCAVTEATGCDGAEGAAFTITPVRGFEVPQLFLAVTE